MGFNEADTCRQYVIPKLQAAGWDKEPRRINEQITFTDGRIVVTGSKGKRKPGKRADYILRYRPDLALAVVEAKPAYKTPSEGLQQAKEYAEILGFQFAYATNGHGIVEFDYSTGLESELETFPSADELWKRLTSHEQIPATGTDHLLAPTFNLIGKPLRYYQEIAVNRTVAEILKGKRRILLTMATGTGKTLVAFQICWKLWSSRWNRISAYRRPRILYLSDRRILVDDPKDKIFAPFGDARWKIENGETNKGREMYFAVYQAIAQDIHRPGLYKEYAPDFFDLIIVDECHRGSAQDESNWREILQYFEPAYQIGMTATPRRDENVNTYNYFGAPIYTYTLKQGIDDGFLAPYRVHRILTKWDQNGWRPSPGEIDRYKREIPDQEYGTADFERRVSLRARTETIAKHLTEYLKATDRYAKTIVFCVDQEHALDMRHFLNNLNADLVKQNSDYVCRVTADEGDIGRGHLSNFQDVDRSTPVILTTSQLLTTGVDAPTARNIVLIRVINSMVEFKQIIGRGTRVREDYDKLYFTILDYTGCATQLFSDPAFDGFPAWVGEDVINDEGKTISSKEQGIEADTEIYESGIVALPPDDGTVEHRKYYVDGGQVVIASHLVYELDAEGNQLRIVEFTDYTADKVRALFHTASQLQHEWLDPQLRAEVIRKLNERGIDFDHLADIAKQPEADPFDLLCYFAFNTPLRTRRERAQHLETEHREFFAQYQPQAKQILDELLEKYTSFGITQFQIPDILKVPPIQQHGNVMEIAQLFGGEQKLLQAVQELQNLIYTA